MKRTLSLLAVLGILTIGVQSANAFCWSNLNPANWGHCPKCQKVKKDCGCKKKIKPCDEAETGAAVPCNPCKTKQQVKKCDKCPKVQTPCDPCEKLQEMSK